MKNFLFTEEVISEFICSFILRCCGENRRISEIRQIPNRNSIINCFVLNIRLTVKIYFIYIIFLIKFYINPNFISGPDSKKLNGWVKQRLDGQDFAKKYDKFNSNGRVA